MTGLLNCLRDRRGATAVEYALIAAMIAVTMVTVMGPVGEALTTAFSSVANAFPQP